MEKGQKVRVKSLEEIKKTLDMNSSCKRIYFNASGMEEYCGAEFYVKAVEFLDSTPVFLLNDVVYRWVSDWLVPIKDHTFLNDGSKEQRSLCLALIRQVMSDNEPNVMDLKSYDGAAFPNKVHKGFDYGDYLQDDWEFGTKIAGNIPDWPCLNLKPEILEEAIKNCLSQHNLQFFKASVESNINYWFIFSKTEKCDFWNEVARALRGLYSETVKDTNIEQPYKIKENETELQRKKASAVRGDLPEGIVAGSGKGKTTVISGYLCYNICSRGQEA